MQQTLGIATNNPENLPNQIPHSQPYKSSDHPISLFVTPTQFPFA